MKTSIVYGIILILLFSFVSTFGQKHDIQNVTFDTIQIIQAKLIGNHPLGIYLMRLESDFRTRAISKERINIQLSSANVWEPMVTAYKPLLQSDRNILNSTIWHEREFVFDYNSIPSEKLQFHADAVIKGLYLSYLVPIAKNQEIRIDLRSYIFTNGKLPFSVFSSDKFLEAFHSNIAGGEDPFARRAYGLDQTKILFVDEKGKTIEKQKNEFVIPGFEIHYTFFVPSKFLVLQNSYLKLGAHLGINTSTYNPSSDFGISTTFIKQIKFSNNRTLQMATGSSLSLPRFFKWGETVNINNTNSFFSIDWQLSYQVLLSNKNLLEIGLNYHHQSPYQNPNGLDGIILSGERISTHWHYSISHLFDSLTIWSFVFNYATTNYGFSIYVSEDLKVNNAPDIQTGIQLNFVLNR